MNTVVMSQTSYRRSLTFQRILQGLILYSLLVFLWGAWVRISGSGDGCGEHWPFCHGQLIPDSYVVQLWIENFHRISTKLYGFFVIGICVVAFLWFPKGHAARKGSLWILFFTLIEGFIGAILVLKGLVADDDSMARAVFIALHLINTFLLMAAIFYTWFVTRFDVPTLKISFSRNIMLLIGLFIFLNGGTGAVAALSTTLFPSESLLQGLSNDFSTQAHFLQRWRISHPVLAVLFVIASLASWGNLKRSSCNIIQRQWSYRFLIATAATGMIGLLTLGMLSPVTLKLIHLLAAHILWLCFCGMFFSRNLPELLIKQKAQPTP